MIDVPKVLEALEALDFPWNRRFEFSLVFISSITFASFAATVFSYCCFHARKLAFSSREDISLSAQKRASHDIPLDFFGRMQRLPNPQNLRILCPRIALAPSMTSQGKVSLSTMWKRVLKVLRELLLSIAALSSQ